MKSIAENDFPISDYEIVLINNNSTDKTEKECGRFRQDFPQVQLLYFVETSQGLSYARNRGIAEAKGDILVYVDDDATVNKLYLKTISDFFNGNAEVYAAGGPIIPVYETEEPSWMSHYTRILIATYKFKGHKIIPFKNGDFPGGGNAAYRKVVFERTGFFNPELGRKGTSLAGAEEKSIFDKMRQLNMPVFYLPNMILYHIIAPAKLTKAYFNRLTFSMGQSERLRTLSISRFKYFKRLVSEAVKWAATLLLFAVYLVRLQPEKGQKLVLFRWNVTRGLCGMKTN
jgi:glycosyltransferase involved in cell wall biosynthesis